MDTELRDRVAFVTGGSSGIGRATAVAFGREGAKVAVSYRSNRPAAEQTAAMVRKAGGESLVVPYDLADNASIHAAVEETVERWGAINVLVNNAVQWTSRGGPEGAPPFEEVPPAQWQAMIRTSLEGAYSTIQAVLPSMRQGSWGRIVNISSNLAQDGLPGAGSYAAAKAGLHGLSRTLAWELAPAGILTNVIMPGMTLTERAQKHLPESIREQVASQTPTGRLTTPEEVAATVVFLASAANGHINGEVVRVTGGL
jgi:3-oxoacyl-[acyl-carrier protein] reductase